MIITLLLFTLISSTENSPSPTFNPADGKWSTDFTCADYSSPPYPKVEISRNCPELISADQFDDILEDTPDSMRPPSVVLFYTRQTENSACYQKYLDLHFEYHVKHSLPSRVELFAAKYDMHNAPKRPWYEWTPERDMVGRFNVQTCPSIVFFGRSCNGETKWCTEELEDGGWLAGCEDYEESCTDVTHWDGKGNWVEWVKDQIKKQPPVELNTELFRTMREQERWIASRASVTCNTHARNLFLTRSIPIYSERGFTIVKIPEKAYKMLRDFYFKYKDTRRTDEGWDTLGSTQMNFHEAPTTLVYLDIDARMRDRIGHMIRPLAEQWVGIQSLELTSFYGIREYYPGSWLRNHVDRIDTHIVSATLSIYKDGITKPWPLEAVDNYGQTVRYEIPPGYMALYESAKVPHGRPYRLESGIHAGCFLHFRPKGKWSQENLRDLQNSMTEHISDRTYERRFHARKNEL